MKESTPLYHQLKAALLESIESGRWKPNQLLPSEPELAKQFGVSRTTVRLAMGDLASGGYVTRKQGRGTFVANRTTSHASQLYGFAEELRRHHPEAKVDILHLAVEPSTSEVAKRLQRPTGSTVISISRLARVNERPVFFESSYLVAPFHANPGEFTSTKRSFDHVYGFFERHGVRVGLGTQSIRAVLATEADRLHLQVGHDEPILVIMRITEDDSGSPIEFSEVRYVGSMYQYEVNLTRDKGTVQSPVQD